MGIFKSILGALGFKDEPQQKVEAVPAQPITQVKDEKQYSINNLVCYAPKSNSEVKLLIDSLKKGEPCIINLGGLNEADIKSVLDYLGGAVYALEGSISRLQGDLYVLSPKDIQIVAM